MATPFPSGLLLTPISRWPTTLAPETLQAVLTAPIPARVARRRSSGPPSVSIVIVTFDGLAFTRLCLEALLASEPSIPFEVVVIDNASTDGTARYLVELSRHDDRVRVELNDRNLGFAAATNRGVRLAWGDTVVLLNNDTIPVDGWLTRLTAHLRDRSVGLVGAVTNRAGNEAEIETRYRTYGELTGFAAAHMAAHEGERFDIRTATMFCAAVPREVWERVGPLDERFELGLFEDDDFSMRVREAGLRVVCAEDVFVHHFGQASLGRLAANGAYGALFHANRRRWEAKWRREWTPYRKRVNPDYQALVAELRRFVCETTPRDATVVVVSRGDDELLKLGGRRAWHFPQASDGGYAGHHPRDSAACIEELERLRARGADYLVIPEPSRWWLAHYREFAEHLARQYGAAATEGTPATVVSLAERGAARSFGAGVA